MRNFDFAKFFGKRHAKEFLKFLDNEASTASDVKVNQKSDSSLFVCFTDKSANTLELDIALGNASWSVCALTKGYQSELYGFIERMNTKFSPRGAATFWRCTTEEKIKKQRGRPAAKKEDNENLYKDFQTPRDKFWSKIKEDVRIIVCINNSCSSSNFAKENDICIPENAMFDDNESDAYNYLLLYEAVSKSKDMNMFLKNIYCGYLAHKFVETKRLMIDDMDRMTSTLEVKGNSISYSHLLPYHDGVFSHLHGHTGRLTIGADFCENMNTRPSLMSEKLLKDFCEKLSRRLDHKFIWHLNPDIRIVDHDNKFIITTPSVELTFKEKNGIIIIPYRLVNSQKITGYATSEMILKNCIIPEFEMMLADFYINYTGSEDTIYNTLPMEERVNFWFKWEESDTISHKITLKF